MFSPNLNPIVLVGCMSGWRAIDELGLIKLVQKGYAQISVQERKFFDAIEIDPEKWALPPWGDKGGGFWVVGIIGRLVLWYNDIEGGFNISTYRRQGQINEYWCNQTSLSEAVISLKYAAETGQLPVQSGPPLNS